MKKFLIPVGIVAVIIIIAIAIIVGRPEIAPLIEQPTVEGPTVIPAENECQAGTWVYVGELRYEVTGIERHTLGEQSMDLCCSEIEQEGMKVKTCTDMMAGDHAIQWMTDEATGRLYKAMESYKQNGQSCQKMFDPEGNVMTEICY